MQFSLWGSTWTFNFLCADFHCLVRIREGVSKNGDRNADFRQIGRYPKR